MFLSGRKKLRSKSPNVVWQFLVVRPNEHEIPQVQAIGEGIRR